MLGFDSVIVTIIDIVELIIVTMIGTVEYLAHSI